jgi:hypothetical protein
MSDRLVVTLTKVGTHGLPGQDQTEMPDAVHRRQVSDLLGAQ